MEFKYCFDNCNIFCHICGEWNVDKNKMVCLDCNQSSHLTIVCKQCKCADNYDDKSKTRECKRYKSK